LTKQNALIISKQDELKLNNENIEFKHDNFEFKDENVKIHNDVYNNYKNINVNDYDKNDNDNVRDKILSLVKGNETSDMDIDNSENVDNDNTIDGSKGECVSGTRFKLEDMPISAHRYASLLIICIRTYSTYLLIHYNLLNSIFSCLISHNLIATLMEYDHSFHTVWCEHQESYL
jgi:hypothetical protein